VHVSKNWRVVLILAIIASLFVAGCSGGGASTEGEAAKEAGAGGEGVNVEQKVKSVEEKILESEEAFKKVAEEYASKPSTETLAGLATFADEQAKELDALGVEAANIEAEREGEEGAEPVAAAVELVEEGKGLAKELKKNAEASLKELEAKDLSASKYLASITNVKTSIESFEEFYKKAKGEEGGEGGEH